MRASRAARTRSTACSRRCMNSGVRCPGASCADDGVVLGRQVGDAVALDVADRRAGRAGRSAARPRPRSSRPASAEAVSPSARRIRVCSSTIRRDGIVATRVVVVLYAGSRSTAGSCSGAAAREHRPALHAHRGDLGATARSGPTRVAPTANVPQIPGIGSGDRVVQREPGVDPPDAVDERHLLDAVVHAFERLPVVGLDRRGRPIPRPAPAPRPGRGGRRTRGPSPPRRCAPWRVS